MPWIVPAFVPHYFGRSHLKAGREQRLRLSRGRKNEFDTWITDTP
jgi:hypothetical protein